ncbi:MAG: ATP-binding cassette domain-containing protein [Planctomycetes bacterium]|nr:ATP-binding cassette domain-containing protein [Planctomycetota bacterium]
MALELIDVCHRYGSQLALDRVTLRVEPGECYGFIGHNGAGKTTAMRVALGLERPRSGRVLVDGIPLDRQPVAAKERLGGLIETPGFHDAWSARRNLYVLGRAQGQDTKTSRQEADRLLEVVGLEGVGPKPVRAFSHGMRQRLGIAQALLGSPRYVLLDEPGNGLDPEGLAELRVLLLRLAHEERVGVLFSSHQLHEVTEACDVIGVLRKGRMLLEAPKDALLSRSVAAWSLRTEDPVRAAGILNEAGLTNSRPVEGGLLVQLGQHSPEDLLRRLVVGNCPIHSFAPRTPTLEEIYLGLGDEPALASTRPRQEVAEPATSLASPARRTWRVVRYECSRLWSGADFWVPFALPPLLALAGVWERKAQAAEQALAKVVSTTSVNAFESTGFGLQRALALAGPFVCLLASQSVAGERSRGTLRNLVLCPLARRDVILGKVFALLATGAAVIVAVELVALAASAWWFDFVGVFEVLPNGETMLHVSAEEIRPEMVRALISPLLPVAVFATLGMLAGCVVRRAIPAFGAAAALVLALDLGRGFFKRQVSPDWFPSTHLPSFLGDSSPVQRFIDVAQGFGNATVSPSSTHLWYWLVGAVLLAALVFQRRSIR